MLLRQEKTEGLSEGCWEKEGTRHQGDFGSECEDTGEKISWGPRRDRLGSSQA